MAGLLGRPIDMSDGSLPPDPEWDDDEATEEEMTEEKRRVYRARTVDQMRRVIAKGGRIEVSRRTIVLRDSHNKVACGWAETDAWLIILGIDLTTADGIPAIQAAIEAIIEEPDQADG
jgi:hypothetical protein